jgi:hypothetical protein
MHAEETECVGVLEARERPGEDISLHVLCGLVLDVGK